MRLHMKSLFRQVVRWITLASLFLTMCLVSAPAYAASTVVVTPDALNGWWFAEETPTGSGSFVYGPSVPPSGGGSAQLTVNGTGGEIFGTFAFAGTRLDAITSLGYSTFRTSGTAAFAASLQFDIDTNVTDTNTAWQGRLVYEPYFTHSVSTGVWQTWNPLDNFGTGNWWFTGAPGNAVCPLSNPCTWAEVRAAFPNAGIRSAGANTGATQFKAGGGWAGGFVGSVDNFNIGINNTVTTYDFELPFTVPTIATISPTSGLVNGLAFTLTVNGTNFFPSSVAQWNGSNRTTTYISPTKLTVSILASDLTATSILPVTVVNPAPGGGFSNAQTFSVVNAVNSAAYTAWSDHGVGYTAPSGDAYYPSVLYDANGFGGSVSKYSMWYSNGAGQFFRVASADGISWGTPVTMLGLSNVHHTQVVYDANCFGVVPCGAATTKYRMWYWDMGAPTLYDISSMATAESLDGINWINKTSVTQNAAAKLVQSPDSGTGWNRGTYGPVSVFYQPNAVNTGTEPWDYKYVMYYDGTDGSHEETGLAYSTNGLLWNAYTTNPVLSASRVGGTEAWDCVSAVYGTVFHDSFGYHYIFSGKGQDNGSGGCASPSNFNAIGYASSVDGKTWAKDSNPIFKTSDAVPYRSGRIYTPSVIDDGSGTLRMYFSVTDATGSPKKIGYATLTTPIPVSTPVPGLAIFTTGNYNTLTVISQVNNDSGGTAVYPDFSLFINGNSVASGESKILAPGVYTVSENNIPGYTVNFTGDCDANGRVVLGGNESRNLVCTVVNNDIGAPTAVVTPPLIDIFKVPSPLALPGGPGPVTYTYTVTNIGTVPMTDITLLGDSCRPIVFVSGDTNGDLKLDVGEQWIYNCTTNLAQTTRNTVVAFGHANGLTATHITNATVVVGAAVLPPLIHVTKIPSPLALPAGGGNVTYTIRATNPGLVPLSNVGVTEDIINSPIRYVSGDTNGDSKLDPGETWVYTDVVNLERTMTNTVVASGLANGLVATDFALATVVVGGAPGSPGASLFTKDLRLGTTGEDVRALQQFLNANGYVVSDSGVGSAGNETDYFGRLTQQALVKYQKDKGINPSVGYFGPITRGLINK